MVVSGLVEFLGFIEIYTQGPSKLALIGVRRSVFEGDAIYNVYTFLKTTVPF